MAQTSTLESPKPERKRSYPDGKSRLIDVHEVSHRIGRAPSTIWSDIAKGDFVQPIRVKKGVTRWLESDIDKWIADQVEASR